MAGILNMFGILVGTQRSVFVILEDNGETDVEQAEQLFC